MAFLLASVVFAILAILAKVGNGLEAPIPGYGVVDFQWEVQAFPDGPEMNLTGTVEQVHSQLVKINPHYDSDFGINMGNDTEPRSIGKRFGPVCGGGSYGWQPAGAIYIYHGIDYLRGVAGKPTNGPGPGNCGRVSCSDDSAIWWCNDNTNTFSLPSYSTIADCARVLVDACVKNPEYTGDEYTVVGQNFNGNNWNCIVRYDNDHC